MNTKATGLLLPGKKNGENCGDTVRPEAREPVRGDLRPGEFRGRGSEILRRSNNFDDAFSVPESWKEPGWSYQWNRKSTYGKEDRADMLRMHDNGWRPVPASRFGLDEGDGSRDYIERDGLILMERPEAMTIEAQRDEDRKAREQYLNSFERVDTFESLPDMARNMRKDIRREGRVVVSAKNESVQRIPSDD